MKKKLSVLAATLGLLLSCTSLFAQAVYKFNLHNYSSAYVIGSPLIIEVTFNRTISTVSGLGNPIPPVTTTKTVAATFNSAGDILIDSYVSTGNGGIGSTSAFYEIIKVAATYQGVTKSEEGGTFYDEINTCCTSPITWANFSGIRSLQLENQSSGIKTEIGVYLY